MDVNVNINTEIELPGEVLIDMISQLIKRFGLSGLQMVAESNIFIFRKNETDKPFVMLMPDCSCESCTQLKEMLKVKIRAGKIDENEIGKVLGMFDNNHD